LETCFQTTTSKFFKSFQEAVLARDMNVGHARCEYLTRIIITLTHTACTSA
jgi:hypothetical protein